MALRQRMELQPIVGSSCAHCKESILVDLDGKNCKRCGLAVHRRCSKAHKSECAGKPAIAEVANDWHEAAPVEWTPRMIAPLAVGIFLLFLGIGWLMNAPEGEVRAQTDTRTQRGWIAVVAGLVVAGAGFGFERSRQLSVRG